MRVLIADDHTFTRRGVRVVIESHPGWEVCGEASDGQQAIDIALRESPDVVVLGVSLPIIDGLGVTQRLRQEMPNTAVLLYTRHDDDDTISGGLAAGARGYVLKSDSAFNLEAAISALGARRTYFSSTVADFVLESAVNDRKKSRLESFTLRELEIIQLIAEGNSNEQIAGKLGRAIKTVESHRAAAMRKAGVRSSAQFIRFAIKHKLIQA